MSQSSSKKQRTPTSRDMAHVRAVYQKRNRTTMYVLKETLTFVVIY